MAPKRKVRKPRTQRKTMPRLTSEQALKLLRNPARLAGVAKYCGRTPQEFRAILMKQFEREEF